MFLEEVTGSLTDAKIGLRRTFTRLGYATLMLPGAGGGAGTELSRANSIFAAVRKDSASFVGGAWMVAARCLGVQIKHTLEPGKAVRNHVCMHGLHPVAQAEAGERFESPHRSSLDWLEQRGGGPCCWATSTECGVLQVEARSQREAQPRRSGTAAGCAVGLPMLRARRRPGRGGADGERAWRARDYDSVLHCIRQVGRRHGTHRRGHRSRQRGRAVGCGGGGLP